MNLKGILNAVLSENGFLQRDSFTSSTDPDDVQMVSIANRVAKIIRDYYDWMTSRGDITIELVADQTMYDLPTDFHSFVPNSGWMTDGSKPIELPTPNGRWYQYKFSSLSAGGILRCRLVGKMIEVDDDFAAGDSFSLEYLSEYVITDSGGALKEEFTEDSDLFTLSDELLIYGVQAFWQRTKRMPSYQELLGQFYSKMNEEIGRTTGGKSIGGATASTQLRRSPYYPLWRSS